MSDTLDLLKSELSPSLEIGRLLGSGSVARVFLAKQPALKRFVAVKVLHDHFKDDRVLRSRFEREAQAVASVRHSNIPTIFYVGHLSNEVPIIIMEFIEGRTLEDVVKATGRLSVPQAREIVKIIADALDSAHKKGVVHRDLRPANVLIESSSGRPVLMDFGTAAILETIWGDAPLLTTPGTSLGEPSYMSPEQLRNEQVSGQADVYALGVLGYEILTGHGPFGAGNLSAAAQTLSGRTAPDVRLLRSEVDRTLATILNRCLAERPDQRPSARQVVDLLNESVGVDRSQHSGSAGTTGVPGSDVVDVEDTLAHRLAAVWFGDMVGYTTLAGEDEGAALRKVKRMQLICNEEVSRHAGRVIKFMGDGLFAEFGSTSLSVRAACCIRDRLSIPNADPAISSFPGDIVMRFGVHVADVTANREGDLFGDGVNLAARVQQDALPGQVLVTGDVWRQLRARPQFRFQAAGSRRLRGFAQLVDVYEVELAPEFPPV